MVGWNYWTAAYGLDRTVGGMSDVYSTLFTPPATLAGLVAIQAAAVRRAPGEERNLCASSSVNYCVACGA